MTDRRPPREPPPVEDRPKRNFLRMLVRPFVAAARGYELPEKHFSRRPPEQRKVIRGGRPGEVLALLGPLARGETASGYRLLDVKIGEDWIRFVFDREGRRVAVALTAHASEEGGEARFRTASFRGVVAGDAPREELDAVAERVAREVAAKDNGQLWVTAADAPSKPR
jgi:hypothetical protein